MPIGSRKKDHQDMSTKDFYTSIALNVVQREVYAPKQGNIVSIVKNVAVMKNLQSL